jgi:membrane-associated phospholipid phosphatase
VDRPLEPRAERHDPPAPGDARLSFPSGHASLSAALATSWSLSHPRWYVIGPGALWATGVALSRVHLGVHYPSDILAGIILGVGVAVLVDQLRRTVTPSPFRASPATQGLQAPPLVLRVQF